MGIDEAAADPGLEFDHPAGLVLLHDHVVERETVPGAPAPLMAAASSVRSSRWKRPASTSSKRASISSAVTSARKPSRPRLMPSSGTSRWLGGDEVYGVQHGAVPADGDDQVGFRSEHGLGHAPQGAADRWQVETLVDEDLQALARQVAGEAVHRRADARVVDAADECDPLKWRRHAPSFYHAPRDARQPGGPAGRADTAAGSFA